jgi:hypothetical protein
VLLPVLALAACGGDDDSASENPPKLPDLTVPQIDRTETTTSPTTTETAPEAAPTPDTPPSTGGGTTAPETTPPPQDAPENDTAPPADSPAERFEEFCNENPGACG